ncbi:MAG: citrate/2-methylcitrate synthase [Desulfobulbaceae bacterium]
MSANSPKVEKRKIEFAKRTATRITEEQPAQGNPYLAENCRYFGYNLLELAEKRSFVEVVFLLLSGELPSTAQSRLMETLMVSFINPGPRHPATRAAMNSGIGKTHTTHILPIGLSVLSGDHLGGGEVTEAMRFLRLRRKTEPEELVATLLHEMKRPENGDWHIAPGFGSRFGDIDPLPQKVATLLLGMPGNGSALQWGEKFVRGLEPHRLGWLSTGVCAAVFCDLGLHPRVGAGLFQILSAPGILAHGLELANKPTTAMPFLDGEHYIIAPEARNG